MKRGGLTGNEEENWTEFRRVRCPRQTTEEGPKGVDFTSGPPEVKGPNRGLSPRSSRPNP